MTTAPWKHLTDQLSDEELEALRDYLVARLDEKVTTVFDEGACVHCHRPLRDDGVVIIDDTGGDVCGAHGTNHGHCRGFAPDSAGDDPDMCIECLCHAEDHPALVLVRYTPQAWQNGHAVEIDPEGSVEWESHLDVHLIGYQNRDDALRYERWFDFDPNCPEWIKDRTGPFYIDVVR